ncbi:hypothetical protein CDL12_29238 [Handroanthus impetiginosus]|uniref:Transmembrane protein n=1 Tax=Handroanthus impetiginosus TaxID=429701 RepID=A0A2G9FZ04_9LAMI|nr:hypothetical protein CDL12_29238 [Handroanthus impetiginosus]
MDKQQEEQIHSLGVFAIFRVSFLIIFSWTNLFTQITLSTIFPLSLLSLMHLKISDHFSQQNYTAFWLFQTVYFIFFLVLSMLSTAVVVYTVACIYTRKEVTCFQVMSVVPKIWKRLTVTFAWSFIVVFVYNMTSFFVLIPWVGSIGPGVGGVAILGPLLIIYMMGFVYISIIWHLASVVSVLEEVCGVEAMIKSRGLVKGKMVISFAIFLLLNLCFVLIQVGFHRFVVVGKSFWSRIGCGVLCFLFLYEFTLLGLVVQTMIYFGCKLYHNEIIDRSYLENHIENVYLGDYAPLRPDDYRSKQFYM